MHNLEHIAKIFNKIIHVYKNVTVICLIEVPSVIARLNLIQWSKSLGSALSNGGFGLVKINIKGIKGVLHS